MPFAYKRTDRISREFLLVNVVAPMLSSTGQEMVWLANFQAVTDTSIRENRSSRLNLESVIFISRRSGGKSRLAICGRANAPAAHPVAVPSVPNVLSEPFYECFPK